MSGWDGIAQVFEPVHTRLADEHATRVLDTVPGATADPRRTYVDLELGVVHLALPPARYGAAWTAETLRPDDDD